MYTCTSGFKRVVQFSFWTVNWDVLADYSVGAGCSNQPAKDALGQFAQPQLCAGASPLVEARLDMY